MRTIAAVHLQHLMKPEHRLRGLRGLVIHVVRRVRAGGEMTRDGVGPWKYRGGTPGTCRWCLGPAPTGSRHWHTNCIRYHAIARSRGTSFLRVTPCPCGREGRELDHRVAVGVASRLGPREYVRSLLPENLQWLCHDCHAEKTVTDREKMKELAGGRRG